jgi:hypothetical protein
MRTKMSIPSNTFWGTVYRGMPMKYKAARPLIPSPQPTGTPMAIVNSRPMIRTAIIKILSPSLAEKQLYDP